ncbi:hypothetical protein F5Y11DRAFT_335536 [Daldinia sp. FL1419]|nr:hypothetical protein F5Y11DRAFT_335536 [Daldinia sp. FL1419]
MVARHQYETLPSPRHIRLLRLHGGQKSEAILCEFVITSLDEAPNFKALSYVWGNPLPRTPVQCSGRAAEDGEDHHMARRRSRRTSLESFAVRLRQDSTHIMMGLVKSRTTAIYHISNITLLALIRRTRDGFSLTEDIHKTLIFACTQPHDHIIGILGLVRNADKNLFSSLSDYGVSIRESLLKLPSHLEPLALVDILPLEARPVSWAADLSQLSQLTLKQHVMFLPKREVI